jgi:hypothetical protein
MFSVDELLKDLPQPTAEDRAAYDREEARREHRRQHDPILREAEAYSMLAHAWFETERDGMRSHADALVRRAEMEHVDDISLDELARIVDAIEIVRNACFLIYVKLRRAGARGSARGAADGGGAAPAAGARSCVRGSTSSSRPRRRLEGSLAGLLALLQAAHEAHQLERHREEDRRVLLGRNLGERLQVAERHRCRFALDDGRRLRQLLRRLQLALGVDDLRALLALGFRLARHRALHLLRQVDVLHLDRRHLDAPRLRFVVEDVLELLVQSIAL